MPRILLAFVLLCAGLSHVHGKEAEAANEDVPKPPPGFSPALGFTKPQSDKPSQPPTGSANGTDKKSAPSGGVTGTVKPDASGSVRGR
jgi:hypothetical protein